MEISVSEFADGDYLKGGDLPEGFVEVLNDGDPERVLTAEQVEHSIRYLRSRYGKGECD